MYNPWAHLHAHCCKKLRYDIIYVYMYGTAWFTKSVVVLELQ